jgi:hypothetical protein
MKNKIKEQIRIMEMQLESARCEYAAGAYSKKVIVDMELKLVQLKNKESK